MGNYDDIINLPHYVSRHHPQMSMHDRAAQFAPFAALTGHGESIAEAARMTERKMELDEYRKMKLDEKLFILRKCIKKTPEITIIYFCPDRKKDGGRYKTIQKRLKRILETERILVMEDGTEIKMDDIFEICCEQIMFSDE